MQKNYSVCTPNDVTLQSRARQTVMSIMARQIIFVVCLALVSWLIGGQVATYSVLAGGIAGVIPNFYFADRLMRRTRWDGARALTRSVYVGEFLKVGFTVALLVLATRFLVIDFLYLVVGYAGTALANWIALKKVDLGQSR